MLVIGFAAGAFQANCYLLAAAEGAECVVVDPGQDAGEGVARAVREHGLDPVAVLATHGHLDHVHSAAALADEHGAPLWIHSADRGLLTDPLSGLGPELAALIGPVQPVLPATVEPLDAHIGGTLELAGLRFEVVHTPGHTPGSVVFRLATEEGGLLALTGDTLFAGAVGRTDLPGGDAALLERSLATLAALPEETVILPGHGPAGTIGRERAANPFLSVSDGGGGA
ncbi:hypothetical protein CFN78_15775 [Amycolatopsis antarctica]|uniref:Metallo-beta-lactamase domain-containing protein n=1 Tax=Amycolatopsis antarctica TaxID=1854586 RepID=A0A263D4Y4_9PSEU|nr:MBL fold metallo-hydrolase [Amycolatopsis antarctica]OZM72435.1 hypothetical protein CFN78_15775 [Amycolatopsis antarctica]